MLEQLEAEAEAEANTRVKDILFKLEFRRKIGHMVTETFLKHYVSAKIRYHRLRKHLRYLDDRWTDSSWQDGMAKEVQEVERQLQEEEERIRWVRDRYYCALGTEPKRKIRLQVAPRGYVRHLIKPYFTDASSGG